MTPKEKAEELSDRLSQYFEDWNGYNKFNFKQCALILVDEILKITARDDYWNEVKQEIKKL
jgi:hypothetical protein